MQDLVVEDGDDGNLWICSSANGTALAVVHEREGHWFAQGSSEDEEIGPFVSLEALLNEVEVKRLFAPWGNPGA